MRRELTGWVHRPACSHRLSAASRVKSFWNFCESRTTNDAEKRRSAQGTAVTPSLLDFDSNQTRGALISRRRRRDETFGGILGCGFKRTERENFATAAKASWLSLIEPTLRDKPEVNSFRLKLTPSQMSIAPVPLPSHAMDWIRWIGLPLASNDQ